MTGPAPTSPWGITRFDEDTAADATEVLLNAIADDLNTALNAIAALNPTGHIRLWPTTAPPTGYLICDGTAVSRTTYANLFAVIGTSFGAGDGSTTFALPNLKGRMPVGRNSSDGDFDNIGDTGGAKTHTLTVGELANHNHRQVIAAGTGAAISTRYNYAGEGNALLYTQPGVYVDGAGGNQPHNNVQPYIVLNYIIKT